MADSPHPKVALTDHDVLDVIRHRWSPRAFDPAADVSVAELQQLFEAARWAPSSRNEQPWRFLVTSRVRNPESFTRLFECLVPRNQAWANQAPVLVLVAVQLHHTGLEIANPHAWYDAGQAVAFLTLQATAAGLSLRQMQGFDAARAREACAVPPEFEPGVVIAIGRTGDPETLTVASHREAERAPRSRRAISEFVFEAEWGRPWLPVREET